MPRGRKPKQEHLPTMEPPRHKDLERLAEAYVAQRDERMELTKAEKLAHTALLAGMAKYDLWAYAFEDFTITRTPGVEKVKVRRKNEPLDAEDED